VALRRLPPSVLGLLMIQEPAVAALAGVLVLSQALSAALALSMAMVIIASVGTTLTSRPQPVPQLLD
jgi:inner membrane transporter RhtA